MRKKGVCICKTKNCEQQVKHDDQRKYRTQRNLYWPENLYFYNEKLL